MTLTMCETLKLGQRQRCSKRYAIMYCRQKQEPFLTINFAARVQPLHPPVS